jgi:ribose-phosphate pyrophosphokinase
MVYMAEEAYRGLSPQFEKGAVSFGEISFKDFSRGEVKPVVECNVRMKHVYLFYDFNRDFSRDLAVLCLILSAIIDAGADRITLVVPFIPFLRQDRKDRSRVPISAKVAIQMIAHFGNTPHVITLDMHSPQIEAAFPKAPDHLPGHVIFAPWVRRTFGTELNKVVIVGPDYGSDKRVELLAKVIGCTSACFSKHRDGATVSMGELHGADVRGKICIVNDDILDTCGTMEKAADALRRLEAEAIYLTGTHAVFGGDAYTRLARTGCQVVVTDSLRTHAYPWLTVLPLAPYLKEAIYQNNIADGSVSHLINHGLSNQH